MPVRIVPRDSKACRKANPGYGKRRVSRPTRTTPDAVIGIYHFFENGPLVAIVNAGGRLAPGHYYDGIVSGKHSITVLSDGEHDYRAVMPQNLYGYRSNVVFSPEKAQEHAPTNRGVAFVVLYTDKNDVRDEAAKKLQAVVRGFLARRAYALQRAAAAAKAEAEAAAAAAAAKAEAEAAAAAAAAWQYECFMHSLAEQFTRELHELNSSYFRGAFGPVGGPLACTRYRAALLELRCAAAQNGLTPI